MEGSFSNESFGDLIIKDKKFRRYQLKRRLKIFFIVFSILIFIAAVIVTVFLVLGINYGKIICIYQTFKEN